jgi:glycerol-3-phosphate acyltransferase PlsY
MSICPWPWVVLAFFIGALPFSVWIGRLALHVDVRDYGDHNPGATNVLRAGGRAWALVALFLDVAKGVMAVELAWTLGGWRWSEHPAAFVALAVAPVLGHAYSPFLRFRGGKAVAVTFGVWMALTLGGAAIVWIATLLSVYLILDVDGWVVLLSFASVLVYLLVTDLGVAYVAIWALHAAILAWRHRADLARRPHIVPRWRRAAVP